MSEAKTEPKTQKARTSELAIGSLVLSLGVPCICFLFLLILENVSGLAKSRVGTGLEAFVTLITFLWLTVPVQAIGALVEINRSGRRLKGRGFAIAGLCLWLAIFVLCVQLFWRNPRELSRRVECGINMSGPAKAMAVYASEHENEYPTPGKWCDLLLQLDYITEKNLVCPSARGRADERRSHYAMNPNAQPNSPPDIVLLFETKGGWNQFGGPEILSTENHKGEGCNVAFVDTHLKFVKTEDLGKLKWNSQDENSGGASLSK